MQDEAADEDDSVVLSHPSLLKNESKLANFTWASKLSNASSTSLQPGLLQSLTGTIAGDSQHHSSSLLAGSSTHTLHPTVEDILTRYAQARAEPLYTLRETYCTGTCVHTSLTHAP